MLTFLIIVSICNFIGLLYLIYIVYKKNSTKTTTSKIPTSSLTNNFKINLTRFNPFDDIGGNQSFILCILDNSNSGAIITSLHNRDFTRVYAKTVKNGEGENTTLSKEEKLAIVKTIKS